MAEQDSTVCYFLKLPRSGDELAGVQLRRLEWKLRGWKKREARMKRAWTQDSSTVRGERGREGRRDERRRPASGSDQWVEVAAVSSVALLRCSGPGGVGGGGSGGHRDGQHSLHFETV